MKLFIQILAAITLLLWLAVGIGVVQQYFQGDPLSKCTQFETNTKYKGYHCKNQDVYVPPQD